MRGFSAGIEPMMPALHCAITRSAVEAMNIGPAMTGMRSLALSAAISSLVIVFFTSN
ncbi:hypothetical protein ACFSTD_20145 [Novosphingobium colocasiae]